MNSTAAPVRIEFIRLSQVFPATDRPLARLARFQFEEALTQFMIEGGDTDDFCWIPGMTYAE